MCIIYKDDKSGANIKSSNKYGRLSSCIYYYSYCIKNPYTIYDYINIEAQV